jgi:hypothetical protein
MLTKFRFLNKGLAFKSKLITKTTPLTPSLNNKNFYSDSVAAKIDSPRDKQVSPPKKDPLKSEDYFGLNKLVKMDELFE